jgi:lambda family phage portal protein
MGLWRNILSALTGSQNMPGDSETQTITVPAGYLYGSRNHNYSTGGKYDGGLSSTGSLSTVDNERARRNGRSAYLDSMEAHAIVNRYADTVVDVGLRAKPQPMASVLGITDEQAAQWSKNVENRFHLWARNKRCSRAENLSFYQAQRLIHICQQRDGEYFVRFFYDPKRNRPNPLQLRIVDSQLISGYSTTATNGYQLRHDGIERDTAGRETAYNLIEWTDGQHKIVRIPARGARSGMPIMIHGYSPEWPEQLRGYPRYFHVLQEFENLTDLSLAHIKKAINQSMVTMYVRPSQDNPASNPFEGIMQDSPAGPSASVLTDDSLPSTASTLTSAENSVQYVPIKEASLGVPGSVGVFNLMEGEDLKPFNDTAPNEHYSAFVDSFMSHLSASLSMPLEVLLMKFNQNYSASRGALILFWRIAQIWRNELATDFLQPVYSAWLAGEVATGRIVAPGFSDPQLRDAWENVAWTGVPMPNIDPAKTAKADQMYIGMGAQTLQDVAHDLNGSNAENNMGQLTRELEKLPKPPWSKAKETEQSKPSKQTDDDEND